MNKKFNINNKKVQEAFNKLTTYKEMEYPNRIHFKNNLSISVNDWSEISIQLNVAIMGTICGNVFNEIHIQAIYYNVVLEETRVYKFKDGSRILDEYINKLKYIPPLKDLVESYYKEKENEIH